MIERFFARSLLGFEQIELEFDPGLVVFSGPSGAGKSILIGSMLAGFGLSDTLAKMSEMEITLPEDLKSKIYQLDNPTVVKLIRKSSLRSYIDGQSIPKKGLRELFGPYVYYLSVRDKSGFESEKLVALIDGALSKRSPEYADLLHEYRNHYQIYRDSIDKLEKIKADEKELAEKIELATFEIERIRSIDPREGEIEELMTTKRQLSRIEKIEDAASRAEAVFVAEEAVEELLGLLEKESIYFSDALNQLRADMDVANQLVEELEEIDVEEILDRLEQLNGLIKRHGSMSEALEYLAAKEAELAGYTHIEEDKSELESTIAQEEKWLKNTASMITTERQSYSLKLSDKMSRYLSDLKLPKVTFVFESSLLNQTGVDRVDMELSGSGTATLSGGEHNRLRLALMASALSERHKGSGVVILDEIDANVSGDESIAIAQMISDLSKVYQVFAISHQPHLAARADQHFLIFRQDGGSQAIELDREGRIQEIARIIGGEMAENEAVAFARRLILK